LTDGTAGKTSPAGSCRAATDYSIISADTAAGAIALPLDAFDRQPMEENPLGHRPTREPTGTSRSVAAGRAGQGLHLVADTDDDEA